jgi:hypothetical protein
LEDDMLEDDKPQTGEEQRLTALVGQIIDQAPAIGITASSVAVKVLEAINFTRASHELGYILAHNQARQMAIRELRKRYGYGA